MDSIREYVNAIRIIDGHEHLATPQIRLRENHDFFSLLHYLESDLITAGMRRGDLTRRHEASDEEKARLFLRYWNLTKNTTYARMFKTAMEDLYGMREWTVEGILQTNGKVLAATHNPDWYEHVLADRSGIDLAFTLIQTTKLEYDRFRPIMFLDFTFNLRTPKDIRAVEQAAGGTPGGDFRSYLDAVDALLHKYVREGMPATKLGHAYWRTLQCGNPDASDAASVFDRLRALADGEEMALQETRPLQDYLIRHVIERSAARGLPIQIHTGHHETSVSGDGNIIANSNVEGLVPLLLAYPEAKFVLLHAGLPYHQAYLSIAKNFPNVYADFTWVYIISPTAAKRILHQIVEMVPMNKIQGFGGDYNYIEGTYAHQKLARRLVGETLSEKVAEGALSEAEACEFAERIFRTNLIELYKLEGL